MVMTVAALGGMVGLIGIMAGFPGALRAGGIIIVAAACIGAVCLATVNIPSLQTTMPPPGPAVKGVDVQRLCQWLLCQANSYPVR